MAASTTAPRPAATNWKRTSCSISRWRCATGSRSRGKYRVVMTRTDDTFIPLGDRVKIARSQSGGAVRLDPCRRACRSARAMPRAPPIYTLSDKASDAEAARLAEAENKADAIGGRRSDRRADRRRRHPDRSGAARDQDLLEPVRPDAGRRDEDHGADAQAPAEIGRLPGAEGARRALGAGRTRLCLEQGRPRSI